MKRSCPYFKHNPFILLEVLSKNTEVSVDSQYSERDLNPWPLEHEIRFLNPPRHSVIIFTLLRIINPLVLKTYTHCVSCVAVTQFLGAI